MNRIRATVGIGAVIAMAALSWLAVRPTDAPALGRDAQPLFAKPAPAPIAVPATGSVGCSATACHGGPVNGFVPRSGWTTIAADDQRWRSSATIWKCYDPHARAWATLGNDLSKRIESRLARIDAPPLDARNDVRCLACHANPTLASTASHPIQTEGVNCESCHGNAGTWQAEHAGWQAGAKHRHDLLRAGMTNLSDPAVRAETCAGCHVGAPATEQTPLRDMNHDFIAAGHPRLNFDYATYLRAVPPHWAEKNRDESPMALQPARDEYRHWLVGCAATNAARYRLLADRAERGPWPELAEFDCYACHGGLGRRASRFGGTGNLIWNEPLPLEALFTWNDVAIGAAMRQPRNTNAIKQAADGSSEAWRNTASKWTTAPLARATVAKTLAVAHPSRWDEACQLYYALLAFDAAGQRVPDPRLNEIRDALRLPQEVDGKLLRSPRRFDPDRFPFAALFRERSK